MSDKRKIFHSAAAVAYYAVALALIVGSLFAARRDYGKAAYMLVLALMTDRFGDQHAAKAKEPK